MVNPERRVFISYSAEDRVYAEKLCHALEARSINCWIAPRNVVAGSNWGKSIVEAINNASAMILVFSEASNQSPHVLREVERMVNTQRPLIPVRITDTPLSKDLEYFISTCHWLNANGRSMDAYLPSIVEAVSGEARTPKAFSPPAQKHPLKWIWAVVALVCLVAIGLASTFLFQRPPKQVQLEGPPDGASILGAAHFKWSNKGLNTRNLAYEMRITAKGDTTFSQTVVRNTATRSDLKGAVSWQVRPVWKQDSGKIEQGDWSEKRQLSVYSDSLERILTTRVLRVGIAETGGLFVNIDGDTLGGFDIELLQILLGKLAKSKGVASEIRVEHVLFDWDENYFRSLGADGSIDILASGISATAEREEKYNLRFTNPHLRFPQVIVTLDGTRVVESARFIGKQLAVASHTTSEILGLKLVGSDTSRIVSYPGQGVYDLMLSDLAKGVIDAALLDKPYALQKTKSLSDSLHIQFALIDVTSEIQPGVEPEKIAFALRKSDQRLLAEMNAQLGRSESDRGELERKMFGGHP